MKRFAITAASLLVLGAAAYAQTTPAPSPAPSDAPRMEQRMERMERRAQRMEERANQRIERLKADLKLTPQQEQLWGPVQAQLTRMRDERRSYWQGNMQRFRNAELPDRLDLMAERAARGATNMRELSAAIKPLWATLDASQKEIVRKAMPGRGREGRGERRG